MEKTNTEDCQGSMVVDYDELQDRFYGGSWHCQWQASKNNAFWTNRDYLKEPTTLLAEYVIQ